MDAYIVYLVPTVITALGGIRVTLVFGDGVPSYVARDPIWNKNGV